MNRVMPVAAALLTALAVASPAQAAKLKTASAEKLVRKAVSRHGGLGVIAVCRRHAGRRFITCSVRYHKADTSMCTVQLRVRRRHSGKLRASGFSPACAAPAPAPAVTPMAPTPAPAPMPPGASASDPLPPLGSLPPVPLPPGPPTGPTPPPPSAAQAARRSTVTATTAQWGTCSYYGTTTWEQGQWQGYPVLWTRANLFSCFDRIVVDLYYWDGYNEYYWTSWYICHYSRCDPYV